MDRRENDKASTAAAATVLTAIAAFALLATTSYSSSISNNNEVAQEGNHPTFPSSEEENDGHRSLRFIAHFTDPKSVHYKAPWFWHKEAYSLNPPTKKVESGWDDRAIALYDSTRDKLPSLGVRDLTFSYYQHRGSFRVSNNEGGNKNFWDKASMGNWERETFDIFEQYVNEGETTVVDFGTWIGPTMIHHGSFSKRSIGIEADPVAYAVADYNIELNREHKSWGDRVSVDSGCVVRPEDRGVMEMTAGKNPGRSMSGECVRCRIELQMLQVYFSNSLSKLHRPDHRPSQLHW